MSAIIDGNRADKSFKELIDMFEAGEHKAKRIDKNEIYRYVIDAIQFEHYRMMTMLFEIIPDLQHILNSNRAFREMLICTCHEIIQLCADRGVKFNITSTEILKSALWSSYNVIAQLLNIAKEESGGCCIDLNTSTQIGARSVLAHLLGMYETYKTPYELASKVATLIDHGAEFDIDMLVDLEFTVQKHSDPKVTIDLLLDRYPDILSNMQSHFPIKKLRKLLEYGANPNNSGNCRSTPLATAAYRGKNEVVQLLLEYGADPNHVGPLDTFRFREHGSPEMVAYADELIATRQECIGAVMMRCGSFVQSLIDLILSY